MPTTSPSPECNALCCKAPTCLAAQPTTACPLGCPKGKAAHVNPQQSYRDIHARAPPRGCLDCVRNELNSSDYHAPRPCPPGTKPIPQRPLGAARDESEEFLNSFDCQEQPWRSSKHRVESHHEHGCEDLWRPTVRSGKMTDDSLGNSAQPQREQEWRSSRTYIPCAHYYGKSWTWRPCIRSAGSDRKRSCETSWRPSVHVAGPQEGDSEKPHTNCIKVPTSYSTTWKETSSPPFRPSLRYIPAFVPERRDWRIAKGHVCSRQCVHQLQDTAYVHGQILDDPPETDVGMQEEIHTGKKLTPFKEHPCNSPSSCLPLDDPPSSPRIDEEGSPLRIDEEGRPLVTREEILLQRGKKFIPSPPDSGACSPRLSHTGCSLLAGCTAPDQRRGKKLITLPDDIGDRPATSKGPCRREANPLYYVESSCVFRYFDGAIEGVQGLSFVRCPASLIQPLPHVQRDERKPYAPQGRLNEYVIDGHFHGFKQPKELLTEQRSQFQTSKPCLRKQIYDDMNQASRENKYQCWSVSSSLTGHLYEDRNAVIR